MNNRPPLVEPLSAPSLSAGWSNWFTQTFLCLPWKKAFNVTATLDFGAIAAQSQAGLTATVTGAVAGDCVEVTPLADVTGIVFAGVVTAANTVTVYAKNFSAGSVNPASQAYRIIVKQD